MTHRYRNVCVSVCLSSIYQKSPLPLPYVDLCQKLHLWQKGHFQIIIIHKRVRKGRRKGQAGDEGRKEGRDQKEGRTRRGEERRTKIILLATQTFNLIVIERGEPSS